MHLFIQRHKDKYFFPYLQKRELKVGNISRLCCLGCLGIVLELEALHDDDGDEEGGEVAGRQRCPHAVETPQRGEQQQHGQQEQQLAREGHKDADANLADSLEEVGDHSLVADDGEDEHVDADAADGDGQQLLVVGKQACAWSWQQFTDHPADGHRDDRGGDGQPQDLLDAVQIACAVVIAGNGLKTLTDTHDDHEEDESQAIGDAIGTHRKVAAVGHQGVVHEDGNHTARELHGEG